MGVVAPGEKKKNKFFYFHVYYHLFIHVIETISLDTYEGWNFNNGNYLFTTDTKLIHVSKFYCPM